MKCFLSHATPIWIGIDLFMDSLYSIRILIILVVVLMRTFHLSIYHFCLDVMHEEITSQSQPLQQLQEEGLLSIKGDPRNPKIRVHL